MESPVIIVFRLANHGTLSAVLVCGFQFCLRYKVCLYVMHVQWKFEFIALFVESVDGIELQRGNQ